MTMEKIHEELRKITKILLLSNYTILDNMLSSIATTPDRKKIWVLIDGEHTSKQIAEKIIVSKRSVDRFLKILEDNGYVNNPWGKPPTRIIEHVPNKWRELLSQDIDLDEY